MTNTISQDIRQPRTLPKPKVRDQDTMPSVEDEATRLLLVETYNALELLCNPVWGSATTAIADYDPKAIEQGQAALTSLENHMSPNLLCTVIEMYSKVRYRITGMPVPHPDYYIEGVIREGAWGLHPDRGEQALTRRITQTTFGTEFFVTPYVSFDYFEVLERGNKR